ncbi:hypothetical protein M1446_00915, partial [Candidatus Dependentiae bacterium]|nr:hypothetical protein [Candidatus Dependentiae bacterium]
MNIKFKLLAINILFCITQNMLSITQPVIEYLKKNVGGSRQITLEHALLLADQRNVKTIVETGTARGG